MPLSGYSRTNSPIRQLRSPRRSCRWRGHHRPGTGVVYADDVVLTTTRSLGREDGMHLTRPDGGTVDAELLGWDPATNLALLRATGLGLPALTPGATPA